MMDAQGAVSVSSLSSLGAARSAGVEPALRDAFQDFVAGTFYKQMLKALRRSHGRPAYFHGGQAEQVFQSQLDQQVAEDLARDQGEAFSEPLLQVFAQRL